MKILYIALKYDYGVPTRGFSYEHNNFYDSLVKMDGGKHEVVYFPFDEVMREVGRDEMNKQLLETVEKERPDLCFFFLFTDEIKKSTIQHITDSGITLTYNWFADDHWRFSTFSKRWAPVFHWVSTTDSKAPAKYKKEGIENVIKTQWGYNHFSYTRGRASLKYDVSFVGQAHSNRRKLVGLLEKAGLQTECWGGGWPNGRVSQEEMLRIFGESRINLNFTMSSGTLNKKQFAKLFFNRRADDTYQLRSPLLWPAHAKSLLIDKRRRQIKGRNFEVPGAGGFLLTEAADNIEEYYRDGKEIAVFRDTDELIEKARYYLAHERERATIAEAGYRRTLDEHTYEKRFRALFRKMGL